MATTTENFVDTLTRVTESVFETMVFRTLVPGRPEEGGTRRPRAHVVGIVGLAGNWSGILGFHATLPAASEIASAMLGTLTVNAAGHVPDAIGEVTNMIAGSLRSAMAQRGGRWDITVPTVTVGSDFYVKPIADGWRVLLPFQMGEHEVFVELIVSAPCLPPL